MSEEKHIRILCQCYSSTYVCVVKKSCVQVRRPVCSPDLVLGVQHDCVQSLVYLILSFTISRMGDSLLPLTPLQECMGKQ